MRRSTTSMPAALARPITVCRVMPSRKQSAIGVWISPSLDEEDVGAGAFGDTALPVEHHGVGIAAPLGAVLGDGADHVEAGGLGMAGRGHRIGAAVFGDVEPDALHLGRRVEHRRPVPDRDGDMDCWRAAPRPPSFPSRARRRADIAVLQAVLGHHQRPWPASSSSTE